MNDSHFTQFTSSEIGILDLYAAIRAHVIMIVGVAAAFVGLAVVAGILMTPVFQSSVTLIPAGEDAASNRLMGMVGQFSGLASLAGIGLGGASSQTNEALAILRSRAFTEQVIREENLLPKLYPELWDDERNSWIVEGNEQPTVHSAFRYFDEDIRRVRVDDDTGLVTLTVEWTDPDSAADWANTLVRRLNEYIRERTIAEARQSIAYLERELQKTSIVGLQNAIHGLIESQISSIMLAEVREQYAFRIIDPAVPSLPDAYVRPKRFLMIAAALFLGLFTGFVFAIVLFLLSRARSLQASATP